MTALGRLRPEDQTHTRLKHVFVSKQLSNQHQNIKMPMGLELGIHASCLGGGAAGELEALQLEFLSEI